jgi:DNA-binding NtrC family response regulator
MGSELKILVIDDDPAIRRVFKDLVAPKANCVLSTASSAEEGLAFLEENAVDVAFVDMRLGGKTGLEFIEEVRSHGYPTEVALVTGYGTMDIAVQAMKLGAFDCIAKPFTPSRILTILEQFRRFDEIRGENRFLRTQLQDRFKLERFLGHTEVVERLRDLAARAADSDLPVLLRGGDGAGRRHLAQSIHVSSARTSHPFVIYDSRLYSDGAGKAVLLGEEGKPGLLQKAAGGSLLIHELGEMAMPLQQDLLDILAEGDGGGGVRWMATSSSDLAEAVASGRFNRDLLNRFSVCDLRIPDLKDRKDDIPLLLHDGLERICGEKGVPVKGVASDALFTLQRYDWPGNVRELLQVIERAVDLAKGSNIQVRDLPEELRGRVRTKSTAIQNATDTRSLQDLERQAIEETLEETGGDTALAATILGIDRSTLYRKLKRYNMDLPRNTKVRRKSE